MVRSRFWLIILLVAAAGFMLGRFTSGVPEMRDRGAVSDQALFPVPPRDEPGQDVVGSGDLVIEFPEEGAQVSTMFLDVSGRAKMVGGPVVVTIKDSAGTVLDTSEFDIAGAADEEFGRFSGSLQFTGAPSGDATVEFMRADGAEPVVRHIRLVSGDPSIGRVGVNVYFHNGELGPADDCNLVFPVERSVEPGASPEETAKHTLEEMTKGPTAEEKAAGYTTALPDRAVIKMVTRDQEGLTTAEFDASLERGVAGSCRVGAIRSQIENTLRQFPETRDIVISVDGRIDDVLQP